MKGGQHILIRAVTGPNPEAFKERAMKPLRELDNKIDTHPVLKRFKK